MTDNHPHAPWTQPSLFLPHDYDEARLHALIPSNSHSARAAEYLRACKRDAAEISTVPLTVPPYYPDDDNVNGMQGTSLHRFIDHRTFCPYKTAIG